MCGLGAESGGAPLNTERKMGDQALRMGRWRRSCRPSVSFTVRSLMSCGAGEVSALWWHVDPNTERLEGADRCGAHRVIVERREEQLTEELGLGDARQARHPAARAALRKSAEARLGRHCNRRRSPPRQHGRGAGRSPSAQPHARPAGQCVRLDSSARADQKSVARAWRARLPGARPPPRALVLLSAAEHEAAAPPPSRCSFSSR